MKEFIEVITHIEYIKGLTFFIFGFLFAGFMILIGDYFSGLISILLILILILLIILLMD